MPTYETIHDASLFAALGLLLAIITMRYARPFRKGMVTMVILMALSVGSLTALSWYGNAIESRMLVTVLREVALLVLAFALIRIGVIFLFEVVLAQASVPRMMADVLLVVTLVVYAIYRLNEVGVNLASLITTSAVLTGVIAFSMQEMLGNLWGGIALQADNTCRIGDWIRVDGVAGQIIGIRWRCLAIATNDGETVMIPNAQLVKGRVTVLARRGDMKVPWRRPVEFSVSYETSPSRVIAVVEAMLARAEIPNVATEPRAVCTCRSFDDNAIHYAVLYWLTDPFRDQVTDSHIRTHVFATLSRHQMEIPLPHRVLLTPDAVSTNRQSVTANRLAKRLDVLSRLSLFAELTDGERRALAAELSDAPYVAGDVISREGDVSDSLFILASGTVEILREGTAESADRTHLAELTAPNYFGEMGLLTGQARFATAIAKGDVLCHRLEKRGFDAILKARPELAEALSQVLAARAAANDATLQAMDDAARRKRASGNAGEFLRKIRLFFDLA
ncbi:MAG TPA: mechanosensitive ion channel family protein [Casimicrobiaceae bacterium]|nr:mechanosensitive ion channel family protein [Casimicrobiaceae bacterium]